MHGERLGDGVEYHLMKQYSDTVLEKGPLRRGGGLGSRTIFKNLMSPTPRRKWYLTTGRRSH